MSTHPHGQTGAGELASGAPTSLERLLTYHETGKVLGITERTVWSLVDAGAPRAVRFGRSVRIDPADLRAFIDRAKAGGA